MYRGVISDSLIVTRERRPRLIKAKKGLVSQRVLDFIDVRVSVARSVIRTLAKAVSRRAYGCHTRDIHFFDNLAARCRSGSSGKNNPLPISQLILNGKRSIAMPAIISVPAAA